MTRKHLARSSAIAVALCAAVACSGDVGSNNNGFAGVPSAGPGSTLAPGGSPALGGDVPGAPVPGGSAMPPPGPAGAVPGQATPAQPGSGEPATPGAPTATPAGEPATPGVGPADPNLDTANDPSLSEPIPSESAGPLSARRLTPREYSNTLRDLLGDLTSPGDALPDEASLESGFPVIETTSTVSAKVFMDTAERLAAEGAAAIPCSPMGGNETACATQFIDEFGRRAFRRPVLASERENLLVLFDRARELGFEFETSLQHVTSAMLQSSGLLYLWEVGEEQPPLEGGLIPLSQHQLASRLSYLIWGSMPDETLSAAADAGQLSDPQQIEDQALRLLSDGDRAGSTLGEFHVRWLKIENLHDLVKDPTVYPDYGDDVRDALLPELEAFVSSVILDGEGTSRALFTATHTYANPALANVYGVSSTGMGLSEVTLDPAERAGLLTQLAFLASNANTTGSNPPRRGKVVWEEVMCGAIPPPPANVPAVDPPSESTTTRQRFEAHSENPCAAACHGILDPVGFAFEHYDGIGAHRSEENGIPINASGIMTTPAGGMIEFENAVELMARLGESYEVERCIATNWFRFMLGRDELDADTGSLETAYRAAGAGPTTDFSVRDFIVAMAQSTAFRYRSPE